MYYYWRQMINNYILSIFVIEEFNLANRVTIALIEAVLGHEWIQEP